MIHLKIKPFPWEFIFAVILIVIGGFLMTKCNNGEHRIINYNEQVQIDTNDNYNTKAINKDSLNTDAKNKHISDSLTLTEHRVYYVDYSYSMISDGKDRNGNSYYNRNVNGTGFNLLTLVKEGLKESIRKIKGDNVVVEIIPFLDARFWKDNNGAPSKTFTITKNRTFNDRELNEMDAFIDSISADGMERYDTHHSIVIRDFLKNRINDKRQYHMMILLTDGMDESKYDNLQTGASILNDDWSKIPEEKYVFGIFVNLVKDSKHLDKEELPKCFKGLENERNRRYYKEGLNFDFNVFALQSANVMVEHRSQNEIPIIIGGIVPVFENTCQSDPDALYKYTLEQPSESSSVMYIKVDTLPLPLTKHERPNSYNYKFQLKPKDDGTNLFLSHSELNITVIDEKTPNIKFWIANQTNDSIPCISQELGYCKKWLGMIEPEWSDTITIKIPYVKSNDTKFKVNFNKIKLSISNIPDGVKLLSKGEIYLDKPSDTVSIDFALDPSKSELKNSITNECSFDLTGADSLKAIFVNGLPLSRVELSNKIGTLRVSANKQCHPIVWWLISAIVLMILARGIRELRIANHAKRQPRFPNRFLMFKQSSEQCILVHEGTNIHEGSNSINLGDYNDEYLHAIILRNGDKEKTIQNSRWDGKTICVPTKFQGYYKSIKEIRLSPKDEHSFYISIDNSPSEEVDINSDNIENSPKEISKGFVKLQVYTYIGSHNNYIN